jgi:arsenate reductase
MSVKGELVIYGIKNCDTMKKARAWLEAEGLEYRFHDYREEGLDKPTLARWVKALGWETLLNKASTTFRNLPDASKADIDGKKAVELMMSEPTMIKRPVMEDTKGLTVGFRPETYRARFG